MSVKYSGHWRSSEKAKKPTKKKSTRRSSKLQNKSKKMRGGVTAHRRKRRTSAKIMRHKLAGGVTKKKKIENIRESIKTKKLERRVKRDLGGFGGSIHEKIRGYIKVPLTNTTIQQAVRDYNDSSGERRSPVISTYGHISNWDVSRVTDM